MKVILLAASFLLLVSQQALAQIQECGNNGDPCEAYAAGLFLMLLMHYGPLDLTRVKSLTIELKDRGCSGADIILTPNRSLAKPNIGND